MNDKTILFARLSTKSGLRPSRPLSQVLGRKPVRSKTVVLQPCSRLGDREGLDKVLRFLTGEGPDTEDHQFTF